MTQQEIKDPRLGLPSASKMRRVRFCPGSVALEKLAPYDEGSKDASEGTARHSLIEIDADTDSIEDSNAAYTVARAKQLTEEAIARVGMGDEKPVEELREKRLWVHDDELNKVASAQLDLLIVWQNTGFIADYKTLFGNHGHAKENEQLLTQVVALFESYGVARIVAALIQPNLSKDKQLTLVEYTYDEIVAYRHMLLGWLTAADDPFAQRNVGPWCEHCRGRHICKEAVAAELALTVQSGVELATPERMALLLDRAVLAESVVDAIRTEAKRRMNAGETIPGWELKPGSDQRKVTDAAKAFAIVHEKGATEAEFIGTVSTSITKLEKLYISKSDLKQQDAKAELENALKAAGALSVTPKSDSLVRS